MPINNHQPRRSALRAITELQAARDAGLITAEEYTAKSAQVLAHFDRKIKVKPL